MTTVDFTTFTRIMDEANTVLNGWRRCYDALPDEAKDKSLGLHQSTIVLAYIEETKKT